MGELARKGAPVIGMWAGRVRVLVVLVTLDGQVGQACDGPAYVGGGGGETAAAAELGGQVGEEVQDASCSRLPCRVAARGGLSGDHSLDQGGVIEPEWGIRAWFWPVGAGGAGSMRWPGALASLGDGGPLAGPGRSQGPGRGNDLLAASRWGLGGLGRGRLRLAPAQLAVGAFGGLGGSRLVAVGA